MTMNRLSRHYSAPGISCRRTPLRHQESGDARPGARRLRSQRSHRRCLHDESSGRGTGPSRPPAPSPRHRAGHSRQQRECQRLHRSPWHGGGSTHWLRSSHEHWQIPIHASLHRIDRSHWPCRCPSTASSRQFPAYGQALSTRGGAEAARAILTTDLRPKAVRPCEHASTAGS